MGYKPSTVLHMTPTRRIAGVVLALTLPVSACSIDPSGATSTTAARTYDTGSPSASHQEPFADVEGATGPVVTADAFRLRVPAGFTVDHTVDLSIGAFDDDGPDMIFIGNRTDTADLPLSEQVRVSRDVGLWVGEVRRLPDVTIDGVTFYHLMGHGAGVPFVEEFGAVHGGTAVRITFNLFSAARQRKATLQSVLATFEWR